MFLLDNQLVSYIVLTIFTVFGLVFTGFLMSKIIGLKDKIHLSKYINTRKKQRNKRKEKEFREKYRVG